MHADPGRAEEIDISVRDIDNFPTRELDPTALARTKTEQRQSSFVQVSSVSPRFQAIEDILADIIVSFGTECSAM
jgi:hypothetical protein